MIEKGVVKIKKKNIFNLRWPEIEKEEVSTVSSYLKEGNRISITGKQGVIKELEDKFAKYHKSKFALATNSGTSAIHSAFFSIGLDSGDEVIAPTNTFLATVTPIVQCRGVPIFCDVQPDTGNIDPNEIRKKITKKTKAIIVNHLWGHPCDMKEISDIAKENELYIIEDCSHALGATLRGKKTGTFGDVACFSLQASKLVPAGEGGMFLTNNNEFYERAVLLGHPRERSFKEVKSRFYKQFSDIGYGLKYRMHPLAAVLANQQFTKFEKRLEWRNKNQELLSKGLSSVNGLRVASPKKNVTRCSFHRHIIHYISNEMPNASLEKIISILKAKGLELSDYELPPLHLSKFFQTYNDGFYRKKLNKNKTLYKKGEFPISEHYFENTFGLYHFSQPKSDLVKNYVEVIKKVFEEMS